MQQTATATSHTEPPSSASVLTPQPDQHVKLRGPFAPEQVSGVWPAVSGYVERALEYNPGRLLLEDVESFCLNGQMLLFVIWSVMEERILGVIVCEVEEYPRARVFNLAQCAGDEMVRWVHLVNEFEDIARQLGCTQIEVVGRSAWGRVLGWPEVCRNFVKELSDE